MFHISMFQVMRSEIDSLQSNQEETDTRIVIYIKYVEDQGFKSVVVRTPDTDIFFILLFHAHDPEITIYVDIGTYPIQLRPLKRMAYNTPWVLCLCWGRLCKCI